MCCYSFYLEAVPLDLVFGQPSGMLSSLHDKARSCYNLQTLFLVLPLLMLLGYRITSSNGILKRNQGTSTSIPKCQFHTKFSIPIEVKLDTSN